jgi:hypothetical protein
VYSVSVYLLNREIMNVIIRKDGEGYIAEIK